MYFFNALALNFQFVSFKFVISTTKSIAVIYDKIYYYVPSKKYFPDHLKIIIEKEKKNLTEPLGLNLHLGTTKPMESYAIKSPSNFFVP